MIARVLLLSLFSGLAWAGPELARALQNTECRRAAQFLDEELNTGRPPEVLLELASCYQKLDDNEGALAALRRYLDHPRSARKKEAQERYDKLRELESRTQNEARAKRVYARAEEQYKREKYFEAALGFSEAYRLAPLPSILFDLAQAHRLAFENKQSGDESRTQAVQAYRQFLQDAAPDSDLRVMARKHLDHLETRPTPAQPPPPSPHINFPATEAAPKRTTGWKLAVLGVSLGVGVGVALGVGLGLGLRRVSADPSENPTTLNAFGEVP